MGVLKFKGKYGKEWLSEKKGLYYTHIRCRRERRQETFTVRKIDWSQ